MIYDFFVSPMNFRTNDLDVYKFFGIYSSTLTRCVPYLMGIIFGFIIDELESKPGSFKLAIKYQVLLWLNNINWVNIKFWCDLADCTTNNTIFYVFESIHKLLWSNSIGSIIIACHFGIGGIVNRILSNNFWIPISKISLSLYLMHPIVQINYLTTHAQETNFEASKLVRDLRICQYQ